MRKRAALLNPLSEIDHWRVHSKAPQYLIIILGPPGIKKNLCVVRTCMNEMKIYNTSSIFKSRRDVLIKMLPERFSIALLKSGKLDSLRRHVNHFWSWPKIRDNTALRRFRPRKSGRAHNTPVCFWFRFSGSG